MKRKRHEEKKFRMRKGLEKEGGVQEKKRGSKGRSVGQREQAMFVNQGFVIAVSVKEGVISKESLVFCALKLQVRE